MINSLEIKIEADSEEGVYPLLQHVFREITEGKDYDNPVDGDCEVEGEWLVLKQPVLKGRYRWSKK